MRYLKKLIPCLALVFMMQPTAWSQTANVPGSYTKILQKITQKGTIQNVKIGVAKGTNAPMITFQMANGQIINVIVAGPVQAGQFLSVAENSSVMGSNNAQVITQAVTAQGGVSSIVSNLAVSTAPPPPSPLSASTSAATTVVTTSNAAASPP